MRGRPPVPVALKLLKGGRAPKPKASLPIVSAGVLACPAHLGVEAAAEWSRLIGPLYASGVVTALDAAVFSAYCEAYAAWAQAARLAADIPLTVATKNGYVVPHPLLGIVARARADMLRLASEVGLTPGSRGRVTAIPPPDGTDPGSKYFE